MTDKEEKKCFGMNIEEAFNALLVSLEVNPENANLHMTHAHMQLLAIHARTLACHCECLGMNAENAMAVCGNYTPPYAEGAYYSVMQKWGLIDEKGNSLI